MERVRSQRRTEGMREKFYTNGRKREELWMFVLISVQTFLFNLFSYDDKTRERMSNIILVFTYYSPLAVISAKKGASCAPSALKLLLFCPQEGARDFSSLCCTIYSSYLFFLLCFADVDMDGD